MMTLHAILYVEDQEASASFYREVLGVPPRLHVPGMTEFAIGDAVLGLMPEAGIRRLLGDGLPDPAQSRAPRAELYLLVDDPAAYHSRALAAGARELSPLLPRDWSHDAAYSLTPDAAVLAFARPTSG
jgi:catechol 2,3-dioxygenase-like lactoylglutathione lyase family enzyme